ncbi:MAG: 2OG-Fe(II) oxygenase [Acidobacteriota bacterium]
MTARTESPETLAVEQKLPDLESLLPLHRLQEELPALSSRYQAAEPYPHIHLEGVLPSGVARMLMEEFPGPRDDSWIQYKHFNENKLGKTKRDEFPLSIGRMADELCSDEFCAWLSKLTGIDGLMADPSLEGGGMHQTERGGFLNIHADFTMHHHRPRWQRRVNLILFLNEGWEDSWGGALELWDRSMKGCQQAYFPRLNHAVIFNTDEDSFHGYPEPIECPETTTRKSLAFYYYTEAEEGYVPRSTNYRARPGDGWKAGLIWADKVAVALYSGIKRRLGLSDDFASRVLGTLSRSRKRGGDDQAQGDPKGPRS